MLAGHIWLSNLVSKVRSTGGFKNGMGTSRTIRRRPHALPFLHLFENLRSSLLNCLLRTTPRAHAASTARGSWDVSRFKGLASRREFCAQGKGIELRLLLSISGEDAAGELRVDVQPHPAERDQGVLAGRLH